MTDSSGPQLLGPTRCLIKVSKKKYGKDSPDHQCTLSLVKQVVEHASGEHRKATLLGTTIGKKVFIIFDYNNKDHRHECKVLGFTVQQSICCISIPAELVHSAVMTWIRENELWNIAFPRETQVVSPPNHKVTIHPPSNGTMTATASEEVSIQVQEVIRKCKGA